MVSAPAFVGTSVDIQTVDPLACPDWDSAVATLPGATFFHGQAWARVLNDTYGFALSYLVARRGDRFVGVLPLIEIDSWLTGRRGVSLPFTDRCEPLALDEAILGSLFAAAQAAGKSRRWKYCDIRGGRLRLHAEPSVAFYGHTLRLTTDAPALLQHTEGAVRRAIRKAERSGVRVEFSRNIESVRTFHRLLCHTRKRHGLPPQPLRFFENIHRHIIAKDKGCVVLAYHDNKAIAGAVFFEFGKTALFKFGASLEAFQILRANNLLMWQAIEWYAKSGFETLDFGRTSVDNEGLRRFKLSWGAEEQLIEYVRYECSTGHFVSEKDRASGWHTRLFKLLPESLSRVIGAAAYKHVA